MNYSEAYKAKELMQKLDAMEATLSKEELMKAELLACELSGPGTLQVAFLNAFCKRSTKPNGTDDMREAYALDHLITEIVDDLDLEVRVKAAEEVIAGREPELEARKEAMGTKLLPRPW